MATLKENMEAIKLEKDTKIIPENLRSGITAFGVEGTLKEGGGDIPVKLFETVDKMQADTTAKEGDLAVVYRSEVQNATVNSKFQTATFPDTVVLDTAITDYVDIRYRAVDSSKMFDCWGSLDSSRFMMDCWSDTGSIAIEYESSDGITYTRTDTTGNPVDFGTEIYYEYTDMWNDAIGYFIQINGSIFTGLYEYKTFKNKNKIHAYSYSELTWNSSTRKLTGTGGEVIEFDIESTLNKITEYTKTNFSDYRSGTYYNNPIYEYMLYYDNNCIVFPFATQNEETPYKFLHNLNLLIDNTSWKATGGIIFTNIDLTYNLHEIRVDITTGELTYELLESGFTNSEYIPVTRFDDYKFVGNINMNGTFNYEYQNGMGTIMYYSTTDSMWYTSNCIYGEKPGVDDIRYLYADTQFTLENPDELLPGKIAYGKNGTVIGDGSIWEKNITLDILQSDFGFPVATKAASKYHSYKTTEPYSKCLTVMNQQAFKEKIENIEDDVVTKINISDFVSTDSKSYTWNRLSQYNGKIYGANALATTDIFYFVYDTVNSTGTFHRYTFPTKLNSVSSGVRDNKMYIFGYTTSNVYTFKLYILDLDTNQLLHEQTITQSSSITSNSVKISIPRIAGRADAYILTRGTSNSGNNYYYGYAINGTTVTTKLSLTNTTTYTGWMAFREGIAFLNNSLVVTAIDLEDSANTKTYTNTNSINSITTVQNESLNGYIPVHRIGDGNDSVLFYNMNNSTFVVKSNIPNADMTIFDDYICVLYGRTKTY